MVIKKLVSIIIVVIILCGMASAEDLWEVDGIILSEDELSDLGIEPVVIEDYHEVVAACNDGCLHSWFEDEPVSGRVHLLLFGPDAEVLDVIYYNRIEDLRSSNR